MTAEPWVSVEQVDTMLKQQTVRWEQALKKIKIDKE